MKTPHVLASAAAGVVAAFAVFGLPLLVNASGATWYVNASATGNGSGTDAADATTTIQAAINAAAPGDTIHVAPGTYTEDDVINKSLTLTGDSGAILNVADGASSNGFDVTANDVTIQGFDIEGPANSSYETYAWGSNVTRGIVIAQGVTGFNITDNTIANLRNDILVDGRNSTGSITNNTIDNSKSGISIQYTDGTGVTMTGNKAGTYGNDWGINLHLNGNYDGTTTHSNPYPGGAAPTAAQTVISDLSSSNGGWTVQDQAYTSSNRTAVTVSTSGTASSQGDPLGPLNTIQNGVNAVISGGTVNVAAGTYKENVTLSQPVTLDGANAGVAGTSANRTAESIIDGSGSTGIGAFEVTADNVTIDGFTIENSIYAIHTSKSNDEILNNIISGNTFGISLQGDSDTVKDNLIENNTLSGAASGDGIYSDAGLTNATIEDNTFTGNTSAAVVIAGSTGQSNITISGNTADNTLPVLFNASEVTISNNTINSGSNSGIYLGGGDSSVSATGNTITTSGKGVNVDGTGNSGISATNNDLSGAATGISVTSGAITDSIVDGASNWWGNVSGPTDTVPGDGSNPDTNPGGTGSIASGAVDYSDWCTDASCKAFTMPPAPTNLEITQNGQTYVCADTYLNSNGTSPHTTTLVWSLPAGETSIGYKVVPTYPSGSHGTTYSGTTGTSQWIAANIGQGYGKAPNDQGTYSYSVSYEDGNHVWSSSATCSLVYDTVVPTVSVTPAAGSMLSGSVTFDITINDANAATSSNKSIWVYLYNTNGNNSDQKGAKVDLSSGSGTFTVDTTALPDGTYDLDVGVVKDAAGNSSGKSDNYFKNYTIANALAAPTNLYAKFQYDTKNIADGATLNKTASTTGNNLLLGWAAPSGTVTGYRILTTYPDGTTNLSYQGSNNWAWIVAGEAFGSQQGKYTFQVEAVNSNDNDISPLSAPFTLSYDTKSPTAQFNPVPAEYVNGNFTVSGTASDNVALKNVFFDVRDPNAKGNQWVAGCVSGSQTTTWTVASTSLNTSCTINTANLTEGYPYILRIHAGDYAGYGGGAQQTLILDKTRPNAAITAPANGSTQTGTFTITGTATDTISGIDHVNIYVSKVVAPNAKGSTFGGYAVDDQPATWDAGTGTFSYDVTGLADGTYAIKADAFDKAGNEHFASPSPTITVQNVAPVYVTTDAATGITFSDATLNGENVDSSADGHSFWVSTSTFATSSASIPANVYSTPDFGSIDAHTDFSATLSSLTTDAIVSGGAHSTMPAITPNTTYYYVAWSHVGGTWYPGVEQMFTTAGEPSVTTDPATAITTSDATLNGTNGSVDATDYLFWVSTSTIDTSNPNTLPTGAVRTQDFATPVAAGGSFSVSLSSLTSAGIPTDLAAITAGTTYYYVAWVEVNGTWYPGAVQSFTTNAAPPQTKVDVTVNEADIATSTSDLAANPSKWYFEDDQNDILNDNLGGFVNGPSNAPLGNGSAQISISGTSEGTILGTLAFAGLPLSDLKTLSYSTYRSAGDPADALALQFDINTDGTTTPATYEGRLVYEPYLTGATVETGSWQNWDAFTGGGWWFSHAGKGVTTTCTQATPCTLAQVLSQFKNIGITGVTGFKAGSGWNSFTGNVDNFVIEFASSTSDVTATYDFEPRVGTVTTITNASTLENNTSTVGDPVTVEWSVAPSTGTGTPTGTVSVYVNGSLTPSCSADVSNGQCSFTPTSSGSIEIEATYAANSTYDQSTSATVTHQVNAASNNNNNGGSNGGTGSGGNGPVSNNSTYDLNGDGHVNLLDFNILIGNWGKKGQNIPGDFNGDGVVNLLDLNLFLIHWLA